MKLEEVIKLYPALLQASNLSLPAKVAYRFSKILRKLEPEVKDFQKAQEALFDKLGVTKSFEGEEDKKVIKAENIPQFNQESKAILEEEVSISGIAKIKISDLLASDTDMEAAMLFLLEPFLEEDEEVDG